ncbi:hypothetical protein [Actinoplanes derwentensis]|uniref:Uncharacterized protein n=1 Tax=Actinoplanes derwentensis TaxID=113562 RepID=A0A1H2BHC9_9ACTN|nr:hypothetical protein [Actinoplanes derwentensis]GID87825.1 hypothetical protein Ade03nite_67490 [Actinoplanes derwentensis]SDT57720.1 hypothetical protein SAMN04489716_4622 [Actinoplanes derwentensis]
MLMALLLDAANIIGGLLLAIPILGRFPAVARVTGHIARWQWLVGIIALVAGGYYLIVHLISGPRLFHFEVVGIAVGVILAWDRLTGKKPLVPAPATSAGGSSSPGIGWPSAGAPPEHSTATPPATAPADLSGPALLIAVFGIIAIIVGLQGLFTPN